jgi:histone H3/H4
MEENEEDKHLTNPSIMRLARKAGVKNFSAGSYPIVNKMIEEELFKLISVIKVVNSEKSTRTIMISDVYQAFNILGEHITYSEKLNKQTTKKL